ncbi:DUF4148 domain-containing protein [Paraburkholderia strydomiana]|uniref:DUF4148 domain-containing protein n=1 Tax=Paraburkholderia strydomiana TaxID=1245417 RepID=UPI001BE69662|nr:DUF4148 domain-containing protein [Paraburkholderia strydomiana]MBT2794581.1 hypothetical protein [Paraburkholderia strydomiana]
MKMARKSGRAFALLVVVLAGCAAGDVNRASQSHLSAVQCRDLTAIRNKAPASHERSMSELAALRAAGYHPEWRFDPYYPADLEAAQRQVNTWYVKECTTTPPG